MNFNIQHSVSLQPYNTFGLNITTKYFTILNNKNQLQDLPHLIQAYPKFMFLGGGSNVLFINDYDGLIILNELKDIIILDNNNNYIDIEILSGNIWHDTVQYCVAQNWYGIENMALIPGTVGAAPIQNIGAYGTELKEVLLQVKAVNLNNGQLETFSNSDCNFGYRDSIFKNKYKNKYYIYSIIIRLQHHGELNTSYGAINQVLQNKGIAQANIKDVFNAVIEIRSSKLPNPKELGNSGSFFKNPIVGKNILFNIQQQYPTIPFYTVDDAHVKIPAAWLIEQSGFKGKRIGNTGNHKDQALVIVNYGNATGQEIWQHAQTVIKTVQEKFSITLEPEVNVIA
ncbi:MAG: UDP-N-acetylmuramate dehydrogenase [Chitinophagales bacterium]|nr:UDP-N-acetylmuramate dehydrogenase [Chitinophagales bacterium]